jgi:hypothetical protein
MTERFESLDIYASFKKSKYLSNKLTNYFQIYEDLFARFRNRKFTFVEIGVNHGGSLFMWRDYFGPEARIIGVDLNPAAKQWESSGFEIFIGDQGDPGFWREFFAAVGDVDVILDDGGHTNRHQIVTVHEGISHVRNGGMLVVEDTCTSYFRMFGNPSRYSFVNYVKSILDRLHLRSADLPATDLIRAVHSVSVYDSLVCFHVDRDKCAVRAAVWNEGAATDAENFWMRGGGNDQAGLLHMRLQKRLNGPGRFAPLRKFLQRVLYGFWALWMRYRSRSLRKYFP